MVRYCTTKNYHNFHYKKTLLQITHCSELCISGLNILVLVILFCFVFSYFLLSGDIYKKKQCSICFSNYVYSTEELIYWQEDKIFHYFILCSVPWSTTKASEKHKHKQTQIQMNKHKHRNRCTSFKWSAMCL